MTDKTIPLDACCGNCGYYITSAILSGCVLPMIIGDGFMVHVDDSDVCRDWEQRGETEPVSNPYKLHTCENCHHSIWDKEGCYCNRVIAEMHKVKENDTCEHWEEEKEYC